MGKSGRMEIKAYVSSPMGVPGGTMGIIFTPVPSEIKYYEPELVAVQTFSKNKGGSKKPAGLDSVYSTHSQSVRSIGGVVEGYVEVCERCCCRRSSPEPGDRSAF